MLAREVVEYFTKHMGIMGAGIVLEQHILQEW